MMLVVGEKKVRNKLVKKKVNLDKGFNIKKSDKLRVIALDYVVDVVKRIKNNDNPKFTK